MALRTKLLDTEKQWLVDLTKQNIAAAGWDRAAGIKATQDQMKAVQWNGTNSFEQAQTMYQNEKQGNVWVTPTWVTTTFGGWEVKPFTWTPEAQRVDNVMPTEDNKITNQQVDSWALPESQRENIPQNQVTTRFWEAPKIEKTITETPQGTTTVTKEQPVDTSVYDPNKVISRADVYVWWDGNQYQTVRNSDGTLTTINATTGQPVTGKYSASERDSIKQWFLQPTQQNLKAGDIFSQLLVNPNLNTQGFDANEVAIAKNRLKNYSAFSWMTDSQLSSALSTGKLIKWSETYNDLLSNPTLKVRLDNINKVSGISDKTTITEKEETASADIIGKNLNIKTALEDGFISASELQSLTQTEELTKLASEKKDRADEYTKLKSEYDAIEDQVREELQGSGATSTAVEAEIFNRQKSIYPRLLLAKGLYDNTLWAYKDELEKGMSLFNTNLWLYTKQQEREQALSDEQRKLEQQYQYQYGDLNSTNPTLQNIAVERAVADMYTKYPIPWMESQSIKVQKVKDLMAQWMTWTQAIAQVESEIRNSQRYKDYLASEKGKLQWTWTQDWSKLDDNTLYNSKTGAIKNISGTTTWWFTVTSWTTQNRPDRNNNPGNLKMWDVWYWVDDQNHTIFWSAAEWYQAMINDISSKLAWRTRTGLTPESTLADLGKVYAEDPNWANSVSRLSGYSLTTKLKDIDVNKLAPAIAKQEWFTWTITQWENLEWITNIQDITFPEKTTEFKTKSYNYWTRMDEADRILRNMEEKYKDSWTLTEYLAPRWIAPNFLKTSDRQQFEQAQRNFINAVLRQESWAVISDEEFDNAKKQYFPSAWDTEDTINQKRKNRETSIFNMLKSAWKDEKWRDISNIWKGLKQNNTPSITGDSSDEEIINFLKSNP